VAALAYNVHIVPPEDEQAYLVWFENTDGSGQNFQVREPNKLEIGTITSLATADMDGDGDVDLVGGMNRKVAWWENTDGLGTFGPERVITRRVVDTKAIQISDFDRDGDADVFSVSSGKIAWYPNTDGRGSFDSQRIIAASNLNFTYAAYAADIDSDGDVDVASTFNAQFGWRENVDGRGTFGAQQLISLSMKNVNAIGAADVDKDGDIDLISTSQVESRVSWHEQRLVGDVNDDGRFNSADLVRVFQSGEYEDEVLNNSTFDDGDWNGDGEFNSADLVLAFQAGSFDATAHPAMTDMAAAVESLFEHYERTIASARNVLDDFNTRLND
jgi:hypothetical protein